MGNGFYRETCGEDENGVVPIIDEDVAKGPIIWIYRRSAKQFDLLRHREDPSREGGGLATEGLVERNIVLDMTRLGSVDPENADRFRLVRPPNDSDGISVVNSYGFDRNRDTYSVLARLGTVVLASDKSG